METHVFQQQVQAHEYYGKSAAQTALRFLIQSGVVVIPKSTHKIRMIQNFCVLNVYAAVYVELCFDGNTDFHIIFWLYLEYHPPLHF